MLLNKLIDIFMFREGTLDDDKVGNPVVTTGSIVWGVLLRSTISVILIFLLLNYSTLREHWWISFFFIWFFVAYPAYRQFTRFNQRIENLSEDTLCGSCRHFRKEAQICEIYDEHITKDYIPCEGNDWEPKSTFN
jgi:hypothetical protein